MTPGGAGQLLGQPRHGWPAICPESDCFVLPRPDGTWHLFDEVYDPADRSAYERHSLALRPHVRMVQRAPQVSLIVFVSEACNLRCDYCKVSAMINAPNKKRTDVDAIAHSIVTAASGNEGRVDVIFYGGEPLLQHEAIDRICTLVDEQALAGQVIYSMTTNGTVLNDRILEILRRHRICVGVSIDGNPDYHDEHRGSVAGRGTHSRAVANYSRMKAQGVECGPICVVSDPGRLIETFDYFVEHFGDRFVHLKPLEVQGTEDPGRLADYFQAYADSQLGLLARNVASLKRGDARLVETRTVAAVAGVLHSADKNVRGCRTSGSPIEGERGPRSCSIGHEILGVEADGGVIPCPNVKKYARNDPERIEAIARRGGYCEGCGYEQVCPSFCLAEMDEGFVDSFLTGGDTSPVDVQCAYNRRIVDGVFSLYRRDPHALLAYANGN